MQTQWLTACAAVYIIFMCVAGVESQVEDDCQLSNLGVLPCRSRKSNKSPTDNQYGIYRTNIRIGGSGLLECIYRDPTKKVQNEIIGNITDLGSPDLLLLYSPGFLIDGVYPNQMVMIFNIQCPGGKQAYFNTTSLMVEQKCEGVCVDYVLVDHGPDIGVDEICDNTTKNEFPLEEGKFQITFRTSRRNPDFGFETYVICFDPQEKNLEGCTVVDSNGTVVVEEEEKKKRRRRELEEFHNGWQQRLKRATPGLRFQEVNILIGDTVTFNRSVITIFRGQDVIYKFRGVIVLYTLDLEGLGYYFREAAQINDKGVKEFFELRGPGPLQVIGRHVYFQQFAIDPRGIIPTPEEAVSLDMMTTALLDTVPEEMDPNVAEIDLSISTATAPPDPFGRRRRQDGVVTEDFISDAALKEALRTENACNPVIRTASRILLEYAERTAKEEGNLDEFLQTLDELRKEIEEEMMPGSGLGEDDNLMPGDP